MTIDRTASTDTKAFSNLFEPGSHGNSTESYKFRAVVVPDFSGGSSIMFEARTLFFLASWLDAAERSSMPSLTLHCIGEPPSRVVRLAEHAGAAIVVDAPLKLSKTANKLRGLVRDNRDEPILLMDADIVVLGSLRGLDDISADFSVSRASRRFEADRYWSEVYPALGLPVPTGKIMPVEGSDGLPAYEMFPYFNSGVVFARQSDTLARVWEQHLVWLQQHYYDDRHPPRIVRSCDQVGLATAIHALASGGNSFELLHERFNVRPPHLRGGMFDMGSTVILHLIGFLRGLADETELPKRVLTDTAMFADMLRQGSLRNGSNEGEQADLLSRYMTRLWERRVAPLYTL